MVWAILGSYLLFGSLGWFGGWVLSGTLPLWASWLLTIAAPISLAGLAVFVAERFADRS